MIIECRHAHDPIGMRIECVIMLIIFSFFFYFLYSVCQKIACATLSIRHSIYNNVLTYRNFDRFHSEISTNNNGLSKILKYIFKIELILMLQAT